MKINSGDRGRRSVLEIANTTFVKLIIYRRALSAEIRLKKNCARWKMGPKRRKTEERTSQQSTPGNAKIVSFISELNPTLRLHSFELLDHFVLCLINI